MSEALENAAKAVEATTKSELYSIGGWRFYKPHARAAVLAFLDTEGMLDLVISSQSHIAAGHPAFRVNEPAPRQRARAVLLALRAEAGGNPNG